MSSNTIEESNAKTVAKTPFSIFATPGFPYNISHDALLKRNETSIALNANGIPVSEPTLATLACRGGGPPYRKFSGRVLYRWGDVLEWAEAKFSRKVNTASELKGAK